MANIAFIGLGHMGVPMVQHLSNQGHKVRAYDISAAARASLSIQTTQIMVVDSLADALAGATIIVSMLSTAQQVRALYLGEAMDENSRPHSGAFALLKRGGLVIDCSTIAVEDAQYLARAAAAEGLEFVEAPVSGSIAGAKVARLTFIVGGSEAGFQAAKPILLAMGDKVFHAGDNGAGQAAKICNNMMLGILMSASAETLNLGIKNGVNPAVLTDIMIHSSGRNWALEVYNPYPQVQSGVPANRQYSGGFTSANMYKDLTLALQVAESSGVSVPIGARATALYAQHVTQYPQQDFSSIMVQYDHSVLKV